MSQLLNSKDRTVTKLGARVDRVAMRRLIRSTVTKAFLTRTGAWTEDIANAAAFADVCSILAVRRGFNPGELEVYYSFGGCQQSLSDFALPLQ